MARLLTLLLLVSLLPWGALVNAAEARAAAPSAIALEQIAPPAGDVAAEPDTPRIEVALRRHCRTAVLSGCAHGAALLPEETEAPPPRARPRLTALAVMPPPGLSIPPPHSPPRLV
ncbi:hypothetical protein ACXN5S_09090 [Pseudoroseicyclus sp. H15]